MTVTGEYHGNAVLVGHIDGFLIPDGSAWLNDSGYACLACGFNGIAEREECIGARDGALGFFSCFSNGNVSCADAVHLSSTDAECYVLSGQNDSIGFDMLDDLPCKFQCLPFFFCRSTVSYDLAVFSCFSAVVRCLYEKSAGNLVQLEFFFFGRWYFDQTDIFLRAEDVESFLENFEP